MQRTLTLCLIVAAVAFFAADQVFAQITLSTGTIYGKVQDEKDAPLPGVTVTAETGGTPPKISVTGPGGTYRFAALPIGTYTVSFSLSGFTELRQEEIRLTAQQNIELNTTLKQSPEEVVVVSGAPPAVDTKKTSAANAFTSEYLNNVPSSRDPWVIFDQTPSVEVDRYNVGGNESGQQSNFFSKGGSMAGNLWSMDGINITDPQAQGATPMYFDFESFEEIQIVTGGHDASIQTGGVNVNMVTKRGGNSWSGTASGRFTNEDLQGDNIDDELVSRGLTAPLKILQVHDYGGDVGGPLMADTAWIWGSYRFQKVRNFPRTLDITELEEYNLKGNVAFASEHESSVQYNHNDKIKLGRLSSGFGPGLQDAETTWNQGTPGWLFKAEHSWIPNSNLFIDGKYVHVDGAFFLIPQGGTDVTMIERAGNDFFLDQGNGILDTGRLQDSGSVDVNWFVQNKMGGDHEFKFGYDTGHSDSFSLYQYSGGVHVYDYAGAGPVDYGYYYPWIGDYITAHGNTARGVTSAGAGFALVIGDYAPAIKTHRNSFYVTDTFRRGRLTLNLGARVDISSSENGEVAQTNAIFADLLPTYGLQSPQPDVTFTNLSPRLGFTWDATGTGSVVVRGNYSRFYDIYNPSIPAQVNPGFNIPFIYMPYSDNNTDGFITRDELLLDATGYYGYTYFFYGGIPAPGVPIDAEQFAALFKIDPDLKNATTDELLGGVEFEMLEGKASLGATFTYRKYDRFISSFRPGITSSNFTCRDIQVNARTGETFTVNFCDTPAFVDGGILLNPDGNSNEYMGLEVVFNKRMSDRWLFRLSGVFQDQKQRYDNDGSSFGGAFQDPSNIPYTKDVWYAYRSSGSGGSIVFPATRWAIKTSGAYQFPHDVIVGAYLKITDGNAVPLQYAVARQNFRGGGYSGLLAAPFDSERLNTVTYLDLQVEKRFTFGNAGTLGINATLFNVFNTNEVLSIQNRTDRTTFRNVLTIVNPRILRVGASYSF